MQKLVFEWYMARLRRGGPFIGNLLEVSGSLIKTSIYKKFIEKKKNVDVLMAY
jgi:hypothetical protein